jgi:hypothetical protein
MAELAQEASSGNTARHSQKNGNRFREDDNGGFMDAILMPAIKNTQ